MAAAGPKGMAVGPRVMAAAGIGTTEASPVYSEEASSATMFVMPCRAILV
jgi:hypothetical protein